MHVEKQGSSPLNQYNKTLSASAPYIVIYIYFKFHEILFRGYVFIAI